MTSEDNSGFSVKGATGGKFTDVFGCLDTIEAKHNAEEKVRLSGGDKRSSYWKKNEHVDDVIDVHSSSRKGSHDHDPVQRSRDSKEPVPEKGKTYHSGAQCQPRFKKPWVPAHKSTIPGYKLDPDKWKCYSLSDVDSSQMSERANTSAALSFLSDLRKQHSSDSTGKDEDHEKVIFKKPKFSRPVGITEPSEADKKHISQVGTSFSGKLVMPEYNFGKKRNKDTQKRAKKEDETRTGNTERVCLGHLNEESELVEADECDEQSRDTETIMSSVAEEPHLFKCKAKKKRTIRGKGEDDHNGDD